MKPMPEHKAPFRKAPLWDLLIFIFVRLRPGLGVSVLVTAIGALTVWIKVAYSVIIATSLKPADWIFLAVSVVGAAFASINIYRHVLGRPPCRIENDPDIHNALSRLRGLTPVITSIEFVSRDIEFDRFLRSNDLQLREFKRARKDLFEFLRLVADDVEKIVRTQFWSARNRSEPKQFSDDNKVCLYTTPNKTIKTLSYFVGSYYASFATNEFSTRLLRSIGPRPRLLRRGIDWFPTDGNQLKTVESSRMGNHIGIATIGFSSDHCLVFWRQSYRAMVAEQMLVCTGAGSLDTDDLDPGKSLKLTLANGMERELRKESSRQGEQFDSDPVIETRVTGFYRWARRGGKPEFVGVTKLRVASHELEPNEAEVEAPEWIPLRDLQYPANSLEELRNSLESILSKTQISVSAWMAAQCLKDALEEDPKSWQNFLEISDSCFENRGSL